NVINLGVAKYSGNNATVAYLVDNGTVKNVASQSGFSGYTYDTKTIIDAASDILYGDVNQNGRVDIGDATLLQQYLAEFTTLSSAQLRAADANRDGNVNVRDVTAIRRMLLN
ncbi:MAG: dockerin type I repeat-containing protein, partial [Ruminococcus sp.]|nr:dockerin type I repeat-containing protein [Ruminococcus sp.]